jgi:hypothetical protein
MSSINDIPSNQIIRKEARGLKFGFRNFITS